MSVFFVATTEEGTGIDREIEKQFPDDFRKITNTQWLVSDQATTKEVCDKIGASSGEFGQIIVLRVDAYYGWHNRDLWDWLAIKKKQD